MIQQPLVAPFSFDFVPDLSGAALSGLDEHVVLTSLPIALADPLITYCGKDQAGNCLKIFTNRWQNRKKGCRMSRAKHQAGQFNRTDLSDTLAHRTGRGYAFGVPEMGVSTMSLRHHEVNDESGLSSVGVAPSFEHEEANLRLWPGWTELVIPFSVKPQAGPDFFSSRQTLSRCPGIGENDGNFRWLT